MIVVLLGCSFVCAFFAVYGASRRAKENLCDETRQEGFTPSSDARTYMKHNKQPVVHKVK
jgi:hypothetical protein